MSKMAIFIDVQNDFATGKLGSAEAVATIPRIVENLKLAHEAGYGVVFTKDTHHDNYAKTLEGKKLPVPHCLAGSYGHDIVADVKEQMWPDDLIIEKPTFGSLDLVNEMLLADEAVSISEFVLMGWDTDICVVSNALLLRAAFPNTPIKVIAQGCAGSSVSTHEQALTIMRCCQIEIVEEGNLA